MAIRLLEHHIPMMRSMIADVEKTPQEIAKLYTDWSAIGQFRQKKFDHTLFEHAVHQLIERGRNGENILSLSEATNEGDSICHVCPSFNERCWHGHPEYIFQKTTDGITIPEKPSLGLFETSWRGGISIDVQSSVHMYDDTRNSQFSVNMKVRNMMQKRNFRMDTLSVEVHPSWFLDEEIGSALSIVETKPLTLDEIWDFVTSDLLQLSDTKDPNNVIRVSVSDSPNGTSLTPAKWRKQMDGWLRKAGFA